jgi:hypothetical protein
MKAQEVIRLDPKIIDVIIKITHRSQLQYHEYSFLSDHQLNKYLEIKFLNQLSNPDAFCYAVINNINEISGVIICVKDNFDSDFFGFDCFRITELLVFSTDQQIVIEIVNLLVFAVENNLSKRGLPYYISIGLNNNCKNFHQIFNGLIHNNFYYIHTLLTFNSLGQRYKAKTYYEDEDLIIRKVLKSDVNQIAKLAQTSFKHSRFHLDPNLDNDKAGILLKTSAENSILSEFVDIMYVAEIKGKVVGFYSGKKKYIPEFEKTVGDAVISAIDSEYRGLGIFSKLDANLLNWFADQTDFSEMGTYLVNFPVHKTWISKNLSLIRGTHQFSKFIK